MRNPALILLSGVVSLVALTSGCGPPGQEAFFEPRVEKQRVAFVTPFGAYTGPGNPVFLPPNFRETLAVDGLPLYLAGESHSLITPDSYTSSADNPHPHYLFVEAQVHLVRSDFEYPRIDRPWKIKFQKVVIDEVIRVETFRENKAGL